MSITGKEDKSFSVEDLQESRDSLFGVSKIVFQHEANQGDTGIDLETLNPPTEAMAAGYVPPSPAEIASANLSVFINNLTLVSTRGPLSPFIDYVVSSGRIQFVGSFLQSGGAEEGEIFTGIIDQTKKNALVVGDARVFDETGVLPDGDSLFNLGFAFEVNKNPNHQTGAFKVFRNGQRMLRNVGNAPADLLADGDYHEVDSGNGFGTMIEFNTPASGNDDIIVIDFGLQIASGDLQLFGGLERLQGSVLALAEDVAAGFGNPVTKYLVANPSEIERRAFGDKVLENSNNISKLNSLDEVSIQRTDDYAYGNIASPSAGATPALATWMLPDSSFNLVLGSGIWQIYVQGLMRLQYSGANGYQGYVTVGLSTSTTPGAGIFDNIPLPGVIVNAGQLVYSFGGNFVSNPVSGDKTVYLQYRASNFIGTAVPNDFFGYNGSASNPLKFYAIKIADKI